MGHGGLFVHSDTGVTVCDIENKIEGRCPIGRHHILISPGDALSFETHLSPWLQWSLEISILLHKGQSGLLHKLIK